MNKYLKYIPVAYRESVKDFYKDCDGWWITLDCNREYIFDGYHSDYTIHEDTLKVAVSEFRRHITKKAQPKKLYLAYGSNLNLNQMKTRCPGAVLIGYTFIPDMRLIFRGSKTGHYLSIEKAINKKVPCGVFRITEQDERNLDRYEGYPSFYKKVQFGNLPLFSMDGKEQPGKISAMAYILPQTAPAGMPTTEYLVTCMDGYRDFDFDRLGCNYLGKALKDTMEEI